MTLVKTMILNMAGESHKAAYADGSALLEAINPNYDYTLMSYPSGNPGAGKLGYAGALWGDFDTPNEWVGSHGEEDWFTNAAAVTAVKAHLSYCNTNGYPPDALGFAWCYDANAGDASIAIDPVYGVHWAGESKEGPQGNKPWGLDNADYAVTGNTVNMDTYIEVTQSYIDYCTANGIPTKVFFTTGPVDAYAASERAYVGYLKWEHLRDYAADDPARILFDYADILCWNDDGTPGTTTWGGHTFPHITAANLEDGAHAHIGENGQLRIAKALWWMMARIAGWDGN
jgi:hypothetical protein